MKVKEERGEKKKITGLFIFEKKKKIGLKG